MPDITEKMLHFALMSSHKGESVRGIRSECCTLAHIRQRIGKMPIRCKHAGFFQLGLMIIFSRKVGSVDNRMLALF
jgi:hypothetical protein